MPTSKVSPTTMAVLVVEDDPYQAGQLARTLSAAGGFRVAVASGLTEALAAARADPPAAAVIDIGLAEGDGIAVARGLQDALPTRPLLIALTGTDGLADALFRAGFDRYYLKPPDEPALVTTLEQHRATLTTRGA